jgi:hypothetical protein
MARLRGCKSIAHLRRNETIARLRRNETIARLRRNETIARLRRDKCSALRHIATHARLLYSITKPDKFTNDSCSP